MSAFDPTSPTVWVTGAAILFVLLGFRPLVRLVDRAFDELDRQRYLREARQWRRDMEARNKVKEYRPRDAA